MIAPAHQWIERNMLGTYSEALGRPLTEPEMRVQRCLEQMPVPDWYQKYSRPPNILKNCTPFECRPASWRTYKKSSNTPRKASKKRSFRKSPKKSESECSRTSTADSGYNDACRRTPKKDKDSSFSTSACSSSGTESDSPKIDEDVPLILNASNKSFRSPLSASNSYPRMSRSRKIENINIVFSQPVPARKDAPAPPITREPTSSAPKTHYTVTKNFDLKRYARDAPSEATGKKTHASFLIADVKPGGVTTRVQVFAGPLSSDSGSSDEEQPQRGAPSPHSRFLSSAKKSTALEKIVQTRRTDSGSLIQKIIDELNRSSSSSGGDNRSLLTGGSEPLSPEAQSFVKSMVSALEQSCYGSSDDEQEEDRESNVSCDSELAKSTSISFKSYDLDSADDQPSSPLPALSSAGEYCFFEDDYAEEEEELEYWIPCYKSFGMPRTSSQMSDCSSRSGQRSGQSSPGLSPIKTETREDWLQKHGNSWALAYSPMEHKTSSRQLFKIDETGVGDSGYSDRSTSASSRTATLSSERSSRRSSSPAPYSSSSASASSSITLASYDSTSHQLPLSRSGPYVMKSFYV